MAKLNPPESTVSPPVKSSAVPGLSTGPKMFELKLMDAFETGIQPLRLAEAWTVPPAKLKYALLMLTGAAGSDVLALAPTLRVPAATLTKPLCPEPWVEVVLLPKRIGPDPRMTWAFAPARFSTP